MGRYGMDIKNSFSLPLFHENFDKEKGTILNAILDSELRQKVAAVSGSFNSL